MILRFPAIDKTHFNVSVSHLLHYIKLKEKKNRRQENTITGVDGTIFFLNEGNFTMEPKRLIYYTYVYIRPCVTLTGPTEN